MTEEKPTEPEPSKRNILVDREIIRVWTNAEGVLEVKVELPDEAVFRINADVVALAYLCGTIVRFMGTVLENAAYGVLKGKKN